MNDAPPPSLLITPDLRRQLQQRFDEAQRLAALAPPAFQRVHELLAECVRADPGNILYLDALLANLRRWRPKRSWWTWLKGFSKSGVKRDNTGADRDGSERSTQYPVLSTEYTLLRDAPQLLRHSPHNPTLLRQLAEAAGACDFEEIEQRYWELAVTMSLDGTEVESLRGLAQALTRQGRFEQAAAAWLNVQANAADGAEATTALADLDRPAARHLDDEERSLADAQAAGGPLLALLLQREALQLERARQRLLVAHRRATNDAHPKAQSLVERLAAELARLEIEILHLRCERLPGDWRLRLELAQRLKRAGNFSGAIQRLEEAARIQPGEAAGLLELGECWQHLRQFAKALAYYQQAARASGDERKLALYRAGVLAAAMGQAAAARQSFSELLSIDHQFQDARERLDKLGGS